MTDPNFILLYVDSAPASAAFYGDLLGKQPVEQAPTFTMFALSSGVMLGLWTRNGVEPAASAQPGASEIAFAVGSPAEVDAINRDWQARGIRIVQPPTAMDFGHTFTALDPDGHRLRVFAPGGQ